MLRSRASQRVLAHGSTTEGRTFLSTQPEFAEAHNSSGGLFLPKGELIEAANELTEAVRSNLKSAGVHYDLGFIFQQQNNVSGAVRAFHKAFAHKA
jgi:Tfp pilus assembly protein PilF